MTKNGTRMILLALGLACTMACSVKYWYESNLNQLSIGITKSEFNALYLNPTAFGSTPILRAAKQTSTGLIEVLTMRMVDVTDARDITEFWFLFKDGTLEQWGKPGDWEAVSARYEISFNPTVR